MIEKSRPQAARLKLFRVKCRLPYPAANVKRNFGLTFCPAGVKRDAYLVRPCSGLDAIPSSGKMAVDFANAIQYLADNSGKPFNIGRASRLHIREDAAVSRGLGSVAPCLFALTPKPREAKMFKSCLPAKGLAAIVEVPKLDRLSAGLVPAQQGENNGFFDLTGNYPCHERHGCKLRHNVQEPARAGGLSEAGERYAVFLHPKSQNSEVFMSDTQHSPDSPFEAEPAGLVPVSDIVGIVLECLRNELPFIQAQEDSDE